MDADGLRNAGLSEAFAAFFAANHRSLLRFAKSRVRELADAEDLVAHASLRCWQRVSGDKPNPPGPEKWPGYMMIVMINLHRDGIKRSFREREVLERLDRVLRISETGPTGDWVDVVELLAAVEAVDEEAEGFSCGSIVYSIDYLGFTQAQVATSLNLGADAVGYRLKRGRSMIARQLGSDV